jgi:hypothetical protein
MKRASDRTVQNLYGGALNDIRLRRALQDVIVSELVPRNVNEHKMYGRFNPRNATYGIAVNAEYRSSGLSDDWRCIFLHDGHIPYKLDAGLSYDSAENTVFWEADRCSEPGQRRVVWYSVVYKRSNLGSHTSFDNKR